MLWVVIAWLSAYAGLFVLVAAGVILTWAVVGRMPVWLLLACLGGVAVLAAYTLWVGNVASIITLLTAVMGIGLCLLLASLRHWVPRAADAAARPFRRQTTGRRGRGVAP
jgi:uncharacterized membrane protein YoaK (UPF0700 family)